ncbi:MULTISPECIES: Stp1/IreP family PP2C-type Ser/Thr phosphatase [Bacillus]|uniref:Stp1/IreP family PP2C-type Ser/Thr phosphatase n=1 Tax=Bacillus TaxID=1386 RepID=UPI000BB8F3BB|nr:MULTISPECIES: Stp1/IreP family PP2C-type Ser/Thr phosphatase [Bacillus]
MNSVFLTDIGRIRSHNEDNGGIFVNKDNEVLAVVCDGMGGHQAGDIASAKAVEQIKTLWEETSNISSPDHAEVWLTETISQVNSEINLYANKNGDCYGMGTTVVAAVCGDSFLSIAHVGDSRGYITMNENLKQLTDDHSFVYELVKSGQITKEDAEFHPRKNVLLQALGTDSHVKVDVKTIAVDEDSTLLLCSDGLTNKLNDRTIFEVLQHAEMTLGEKAEKLISIANENGGEDNITVAIVELSVTEIERG